MKVSEESRRKISEKKKAWHRKHRGWSTKHWTNFWKYAPESHRRAISKRMGRRNKTKKARRTSGNTFRKVWKNPEFRTKQIKASRKQMQEFNKDPDFQKKRLAGIRRTVESGAKSKQRKDTWDKMPLEVQKKCIAAMRSGLNPSKTQLVLFHRLQDLGIKGLRLEHEVGIYSIDIAHLPTKIAIESDGGYWHQNRKKDRKRDAFLRSKGWTVIRLNMGRPSTAARLDLKPLLPLFKGG